jgi:hypothetical protein
MEEEKPRKITTSLRGVAPLRESSTGAMLLAPTNPTCSNFDMNARTHTPSPNTTPARGATQPSSSTCLSAWPQGGIQELYRSRQFEAPHSSFVEGDPDETLFLAFGSNLQKLSMQLHILRPPPGAACRLWHVKPRRHHAIPTQRLKTTTTLTLIYKGRPASPPPATPVGEAAGFGSERSHRTAGDSQ